MQSQRSFHSFIPSILKASIAALSMVLCGASSMHAQADGSDRILHMFTGPDGKSPTSNLITDGAGNLYGTTEYGGANGYYGTVFELTPNGSEGQWNETTLYVFSNTGDGARPTAGLLMDSSGNLYGTTSGYLAGVYGNVFELSPPASEGGAWSETVLYTFQGTGSDGSYPFGGLVFDRAGNLYGTTETSVFELSPPATSGGSWTFTQLHEFKCCTPDGWSAQAGLIRDSQGNLYGTTEGGGFYATDYCAYLGCGTVFEVSPPAQTGEPWTEQVLYRFKSNVNGYSDGFDPFSGLVFDAKGNLYGNTYSGGSLGGGTVFKLSPRAQAGLPWKETILHNFSYTPTDGAVPVGSLIFDEGRNLYGTTEFGGVPCIFNDAAYGCGTIFELSPEGDGSWTETLLYLFSYKSDLPREPGAGLLLDSSGTLYGTTLFGGTDDGTVYAFKP
jgi:uncharacterized repeat protein (TIGR03803 family)